MADFINTIDTREDEDIFNELVTRTIVEFKDNVIQSVGYGAFNYCYDLETIDIPNASSIGSYAFANCAKLTSINVPAAKTISSNAFYMAKITYINLPNVDTIGSNAFTECINLEKVDMKTATSVGQNAFYNSNLNTIIVRGNTVCTLRNGTIFNNTPIAEGNGYIYVPSSMVDSYKSATNWSTYADQIRAIEDYPDICG